MPRSSFEDVSDQFHMLEDLSASPRLYHPPSGQFIEEIGPATRRPTRSVVCQLLSSFGFRGPKRKGSFDLDDAPTFGRPYDSRRKRLPREIRRCRPSAVLRSLRQGMCALLMLVLALFGVLHVIEALVGRARLFWNADIYEHAFFGRHSVVHTGARHAKYDIDILRGGLPISCHSHNDYWRDEPLLDAIRWGCTSVEADVWLFNGELYVGDSPAALTEDRTLQTLYINPLVKLLERRSDSASRFSTSTSYGVFDRKPAQTLVLLIDFKSNGRDTFHVVQQQLQPLRERGFLSYWDGANVVSRAVTAVGTGHTPFDMVVENGSYRDIFFDAPLPALWEPPREPIGHLDALHNRDGEIDYGTAMTLMEDSDFNVAGMDSGLYNTSTSYFASTSFSSAVGFVWRGHLSPRQMNIIRGQIRGAKRRGLKSRYWDTPAWPTALRNHVWHVLIKEGADVLNVDDLKAAALQDWTIPVHDEFVLGTHIRT